MKNQAFMKQVHQLRIAANSIQKAIPELEAAGTSLEGQALIDEVDRLGKEYGLVDMF